MKKYKVIGIILSVITFVLGAYSVIATKAIIDCTQDYDELLADYKELSEKHKNEVLEDVFSAPIILDAIARSINDKAKVSVIDDSFLYMYVPYSDEVKSKVEEYAWSIPSALKSEGYKSCIITAVDSEGKCVCGWTILLNGDSYAFLSGVK